MKLVTPSILTAVVTLVTSVRADVRGRQRRQLSKKSTKSCPLSKNKAYNELSDLIWSGDCFQSAELEGLMGMNGDAEQTDLTAAHCQLLGGYLLIPYARGDGSNTQLGSLSVLNGEGFCCRVCDVDEIDIDGNCETQSIRPAGGEDDCDSSAGIAIRSHDIVNDEASLTCCPLIEDDIQL